MLGQRTRTYVNVSRTRLAAVNRDFARKTTADMLVLDAGAGKGPYRHLFDHAQYEAADFAQLPSKYTALDYVCSLEDIPVEDNRFDRILFNQVLEHVDKPADVLTELHRVMKPGGKILCSCPLFFEEHMKPWDYYRYTQFALKKLFVDAGFVNVRVQWLEGYYGTVAYQFHQMYRWLPRDVSGVAGSRRQKLYLAALVWGTRNLAWVLRGAFARADLRWKHTRTGMPKNYVVLADKPV